MKGMKASELRIGNIVYNFPNSVYEIKDGEDIDDSQHFTPIPLTEEWLLNLGFDKFAVEDLHHFRIWIGVNTPTYQAYIHIEGDLDGVISNETARECWKVERTRNTDDEVFLRGIKYVHQLQNLYFALTGEELERNKR